MIIIRANYNKKDSMDKNLTPAHVEICYCIQKKNR